jgi:WD40 repeat protein
MTGDLLQELRRGADKAEIYSIAFNQNSAMLACTSDKGTVHIFKLKESVHEGPGGTPGPVTTPAPTQASIPTPVAAPAVENVSAPLSERGGVSSIASPAGGEDGGAIAGAGADSNAKSSFSFMKGILPKYFSSEWSFAQFRVPETRCIVSFGQENHTIISAYSPSICILRHLLLRQVSFFAVVGADGSFFKANYEKGGEATRVAYSHFASSGPASLE